MKPITTHQSINYLYILFLIWILSCSLSCSRDTSIDEVILTGKLSNRTSDTLNLYSHLGLEKQILIRNDGTFSDTLRIPSGYYKLVQNSTMLLDELFLDKGFRLHINIDIGNLNNVRLEGPKGIYENLYLYDKSLVNKQLGLLTSIVKERDENQFLKFTDSVYKLKNDLLNACKTKLLPSFIETETLSLQNNRLLMISQFPGIKNYYATAENPYKKSKDYPNVFETDIDLDKTLSVASLDTYLYAKKHIAYNISKNAQNNKHINYHQAYFNYINSNLKNDTLSELLHYQNGSDWLSMAINMDSIFDLLKTKIKSEDKLMQLTNTYKNFKPIERGQPAPNFVLKDINNKDVSLESLKGNVVYIDFWGTYCKPCFNLMPALNMLEKEFHGKDIVFVGIGMDPDDALWKKRIAQFNMGGIQLRSESREHPFLKHFKVIGIPRFLLIDKEGNIVDAFAKEPDDPQLKKQLYALLDGNNQNIKY